MGLIAIRQFKGERPRRDPRLLEPGEAVTAINCKLWSGALEGWSEPTNELSVAENQALWSMQLDNGAYTPVNATVNPNDINDPEGNLTADKLEETTATGLHEISQNITKSALAQDWTCAARIRADERSDVRLYLEGQNPANSAYQQFDLTTGTIGVSVVNGTFSNIRVQIVNLTGGWYHCKFIVRTDANANLTGTVQMGEDATTFSYTGVVTNGLHISGFQLAQTSVFLPHRETEAAALNEPQSIYLFKNTNWFTFDGDADVVRGPIAQDTSERTFFTQDIDVPRFTYDPLALTGSGPFPRDSLLLGIPPPSTVPTATINPVTGSVTNVTNLLGSGNNALASLNITSVTTDGRETHIKGTFHYDATGSFNRTTTITFEIQRGGVTIATQASQIRINGTSGEPDQVQIDQAFDITETPPAGTYTYNFSINVDWSPQTPSVENFTNAGRIISQRVTVEIGTHTFVAGDLITFADIIGFGVLNQETFEVKSVTATEVLVDVKSFETYSSGGTWTEDFKDEDRQDTAYVVTYVSRISGKDMEGPPSNATPIVARGPTEKVDLAALPTGEAGDLDLTVKRLYRSNVDTDGNAEFQFLVELALGTLTYEDTTESRDLGETLPSLEWIAPLADMQGLTELHEGVFAAFSKNELLFSEPNQPHAWPDKYKLATSHPIVALGSYGTTTLVTTTGRPYIVTGLHPEAMNMERLEVLQSCVSKRGMVDMGYAVVYPSPDGLVFASTGRIEIITRAYFTETEWRALQPATIVAARFDERYVAFYNDGTGKGFVYDPREEDATLTMIDFGVSGMWSDPDSGDLYIIRNGYIQKWDAGATKMQYTWKSGVITRPHTNMAFAMVDGVVTSFPVTFNLYADADPDYEDMILVHSEVVQKSSPFALSDGYIASEYQVELIGNNRITGVFVATDMDELLRVI